MVMGHFLAGTGSLCLDHNAGYNWIAENPGVFYDQEWL
jgi:hypothetical protein